MIQSIFDLARGCLDACDPDEKIALTNAASAAWQAGECALDATVEAEPIPDPGRPARPLLVRPRELQQRKPTTVEGRAILFHALVHIEFNAINLGWDAVYRFRDMPNDYYSDWIQIAFEEAYHFGLLRDHLRTLGYEYGDFPAHNGLWEMAEETSYDVLARMALVPRCLEARGLDVSPGIKAKLLKVGDSEGAALLDIILRDEIGHVGVGNRWFHYLCSERALDSEQQFDALLERHMKGQIRGPFHREARLEAGFTVEELDYLEGVGGTLRPR
ncbi:hypothetical protein BOW53_06310 [Solemya pervernicosa gill symbiont]|uniref:DUF455 domain-containing protein n=2 Tax=Gammaproteobacteria incertae sedis TaxID=118884 RepID=A0A1T2L6U3_9GAMM|nr:ferritin-like domain-containing protein [Candidatus Reidiella endopervernicosa]OOZ40828.1 hypothetical protein BOW53_06310 [Solemya pervernicosa gill symbiont]QKQ26339.1 ferritin-like domain-containing protein [Candidatus Reidiella endopervernicosa]